MPRDTFNEDLDDIVGVKGWDLYKPLHEREVKVGKMKMMSDTQRFFCLIYTGYTFIALSLLWMGIEKVIYGIVQHRTVDDIISIPMLLIIFLMWKYKTERDNLKKVLRY